MIGAFNIKVDGYTDNQATQQLLNHGRSNSELRLNIAQEFRWRQSQYDFKWNREDQNFNKVIAHDLNFFDENVVIGQNLLERLQQCRVT